MAFAALVMDKFSDLESIVHNVKRDKQRKNEKKRAGASNWTVFQRAAMRQANPPTPVHRLMTVKKM